MGQRNYNAVSCQVGGAVEGEEESGMGEPEINEMKQAERSSNSSSPRSRRCNDADVDRCSLTNYELGSFSHTAPAMTSSSSLSLLVAPPL